MWISTQSNVTLCSFVGHNNCIVGEESAAATSGQGPRPDGGGGRKCEQRYQWHADAFGNIAIIGNGRAIKGTSNFNNNKHSFCSFMARHITPLCAKNPSPGQESSGGRRVVANPHQGQMMNESNGGTINV